MVFVLYKRTQRIASGKETQFTIKGRVIDPEMVNEFCRRKRMPKMSESLQPGRTPRHISYKTPSPPNSPATMSRTLSLESHGGYAISHVPSDLWRSLATSSAELPRSPSVPQIYGASEDLFRSIGSYLDGSTKTRSWINLPPKE